MQERRTSERIRLNLNSRWESLTTQGKGSVCDLSSIGCFILTSGDVNTGDLVRLEILFPDEVASLWGEVVYDIVEMGFALRFKFGGETEKLRLDKLIQGLTDE
jgi:PilZ domain